MNTYVQDETIPIYIFLNYGVNTLKFPINPESLKVDIDSGSATEEIEGLGEISIPTRPKLAKISISSFFWHRVNLLPPFLYVNWLKKWQKSKKPAKLIVTRFNYSMQVTCERFSYDLRAGEEKDIYFELDLQEYRPHRAKYLQTETNANILQKVAQAIDSASIPVLVEIPRPARGKNTKDTIGNIFKTVTGYTTICAIAKKITGSTENWKEIFDNNKEELGGILGEGDEIPVGTEIKVPAKYVTERSTDIISEVG